MEKIELDGGVIVIIPTRFDYSKCRGCGADDIIWAKTRNGKNMPIRFNELNNSWISHFSDCPKANSFRKNE